MSMIGSFNQTMNYIETVLDDEIDERTISRLSGYSYAMFSRIFSILTDITLAEYIRLRKLTEAAIELRESENKVIDIAIKYGYDTPDSFAAAFKNFHGYTPSQVRKNKPYKVFSRIQLALNIKGGRTMEVSIQRKPAFTVAGIKMEAIDTINCSKVWDKLYEHTAVEKLVQMGSGQSFGVCYDVKDVNQINYMACYDASNYEMAKEAGLEVVQIPENEYAVVKLIGAIPESIHRGWKYVMEVFFPEHGYQHSGAPDFEVYGAGDMYAPEYQLELWIPVVKSTNNQEA